MHATHLLDRARLDKIDSGGMHAIYDRWPSIARQAYEADLEPLECPGGITHIVFAGMGGSGAVGDLFAAILSKTNVHVTVTKGYSLPPTADGESLVIATSVSGDTSETLAVLDSASRIDSNILSFSSGGRMEEFCRTNGLRHVRIAQTHSPRASFVGFVFSMLRVLERVLPLRREDVAEAILRLEEVGARISSANLAGGDNAALDVARRLGEIPLIYYPFGLQSAAIRFKNALQENAKRHAIIEDVLEACHNGIVAWERPSNVSPVMITGSDDHPRTKERWEILREYFASRNMACVEMSSGGGGILAKVVGLIYWADYASIYRAVLSGIDPSPIESIEFIKGRI